MLSGLWLSAGHDPVNSRWASAETKIGVGNAATLAPRWTFTTGGDVSATPAVDARAVYVPDWAGNLFAIDKATGAQLGRARSATTRASPATLPVPRRRSPARG